MLIVIYSYILTGRGVVRDFDIELLKYILRLSSYCSGYMFRVVYIVTQINGKKRHAKDEKQLQTIKLNR